MDREKMNHIYNWPSNVRLRHIAVGIGLMAVALLLACIFLLDHISLQMLLFIRWCVGLLAFAFVALAGLLVYRTHREYFRNMRK